MTCPTEDNNKTHLSPETLHLHKLHPRLSAILPHLLNNRQGTSVWYIRKLAFHLPSNCLHVPLDESEDGLYRRSFPSEGTCNRHLVNYTKMSEIWSRSRRQCALRSGKTSPYGISSLLGNERHMVKLRIELVRLCSRVGDKSLLIKLFCDLEEYWWLFSVVKYEYAHLGLSLGRALAIEKPLFVIRLLLEGAVS